MTARWDHLPPEAKVIKPRRKPQRHGSWRCRTCETIIERSYAAAERHADDHHGARLEFMLTDNAAR